jgi:hypothetical protein
MPDKNIVLDKEQAPTGSKLGRYEETKINNILGGRKTIGSGNKWFDKGDIKWEKYLIEAKATAKKSISLKLSWIDKIEQEAFKEGKEPAIVLSISGKKYILFKL